MLKPIVNDPLAEANRQRMIRASRDVAYALITAVGLYGMYFLVLWGIAR